MTAANHPLQTFSIKTAARLADMNSHTIRAWERRYKALDPTRNESNNRREYTQQDVDRLHLLARLVKSGHQISHIATLTDDVLLTLIHSPSQSLNETRLDAVSTEAVILSRCLKAIQNYELMLVQAELESARNLISAESFLNAVVIPLLRHLGQQVDQGLCSIAQEHALSAILKCQLMQMLFNLRNAIAVRALTRKDRDHGLSVCLATPDHDLHEFGILISAIIIANYGHIPHYFGANLPADSLAHAAQAVKADVVLVGNTKFCSDINETSQRQYISHLMQKLPGSCQIWWGGYNAISSLNSIEKVSFLPSIEDLSTLLKNR